MGIEHLKPNECCPVGAYACCVPMTVKNKVVYVDLCIADIVAGLNAAGLQTVASCCGHGEKPGIVSLADGRQLTITKKTQNKEG